MYFDIKSLQAKQLYRENKTDIEKIMKNFSENKGKYTSDKHFRKLEEIHQHFM